MDIILVNKWLKYNIEMDMIHAKNQWLIPVIYEDHVRKLSNNGFEIRNIIDPSGKVKYLKLKLFCYKTKGDKIKVNMLIKIEDTRLSIHINELRIDMNNPITYLDIYNWFYEDKSVGSQHGTTSEGDRRH